MKIRKSSLKSLQQLLPVVVVTFTITGPAQAQDLYWDGGAATTSYQTAANWDIAADGTGGDPTTFPGATNTAIFNTNALDEPVIIELNADRSALGIVIDNTGTTTFRGSIVNGRLMNLGVGGLTINSGAGVVDFVPGAGDQNPMRIQLTASQTWTNDSSNTFVHRNGRNDGIALTSHVLTFAGSQGFTMQDTIIGPTLTNGITVAMDASDDLVTFSATNTYAGTTTINSGTLFANNASALGVGGDITFGGGTLRYSATSAANDYSSRVKNSTGAIALDTNGNDVTLAAINSTNTGGLSKSGTGTLSLTGANTYTGTTTIDADRVNMTSTNTSDITVNAAGGLGGEGSTTGAVTFSGGTIHVDASSPGSFASGNLNISGGVNVLFDVAPSEPGAFDVISYTGTLTTDGTPGGNVSTDFTFGVPVSGRGGIVLDDDINKVISADLGYLLNTWTGSVNGVWNQNSTANWSNSNDSVFWDGDFLTFDDSATNKTVSIDGANVASTTVTFDNSSGNDYTVSSAAGETLSTAGGILITSSGNVIIDSVIAGTGDLSHTGSGTVTLSNANTFSGGVSVGSGAILSVTNSDALGSTGAIKLGSGVNAADAVLTSTAALSLGNRLDLTGDATINTSAALNLDGLTVSGTTVVFTKEGAGTTTIGGDNSTSAANLSQFINNGGNLTLNHINAIGGADLVMNSGILAFAAGGTFNNNLELNSATGAVNGPNGNVTFADGTTLTMTQGARIGGAGLNDSVRFEGIITGSGDITLGRSGGAGNQIGATADLSGYTGDFRLARTGPGNLTTLFINNGRTLTQDLVIVEGFNEERIIGAISGSVEFAGQINLEEDNDGSFDIRANTGQTITISGDVVDDGNGSGIDVIGTGGTVILSGTNTYGSGTRVAAGCLIVTNSLAIPDSGVGTTVSADAGFGFDPTGLSDAEMETIINNVTWDASSQLVFRVNSPDTEVVSADLSGFGGDTIVLKGDGTLDLSGATVPTGVTYETPDGGTIIEAPSVDPITIGSITVGPGSISGNKVTLAFTASGDVDAYASDTLQAGSWELVASDISISPAVVEDDVASTKRFYVLVPAGSGNPYP